jgi:NADH:ubiquinone reductase (H+-translocating)
MRPRLKTIDDATEIRRSAAVCYSPSTGRRWAQGNASGSSTSSLSGVEMAGAVAELTRKALAADFRAIDPKQTHVLLVEAGPQPTSSL